MVQIITDFPCNIKETVKKASEERVEKLAIANKGVMFNVPQFYRECISCNIEPVIGCEFPLENGKTITLFAKDNEGYKCLMFFSSMACTTTGTLENPKLPEGFLNFYSRELTENPEEVSSFELEFSTTQLPEVKIPQEYDDAEFFLYSETFSGFINLINNGKIPSEQQKEYEKRLKYELSIINHHKFATYFIIVRDYVNWVKEHYCVPCILRGSASGSLVLYCLGFSDIDPIANGLIFERFINPDRLSFPDINIEVPIGYRDKIYDYLAETYGKGHVARTAVLSSDGVYVGCNPHEIIISNSNLADVVPVFFDKNGKLTTQYQSLEMEDYGLLTFDIFESINLSILKDAEKEIPQLNTNKIPFDDKATFELFQNAKIKCIYGFLDSSQKIDDMKKLKPESIEDLAIFYATDMPHCHDVISLIIHNKDNNIPCEPVFSCLKPILDQTYGCFVFQEQLMQAISTFSGCSLAKADMLRKVWGKRKKEMYEDCFEEFANDCIANRHSREEWKKLFNEFEKITWRLFPKGHALEFVKTVYKVAYIYAKYPEAFENIIKKYEHVNPDVLNYCEYECLKNIQKLRG